MVAIMDLAHLRSHGRPQSRLINCQLRSINDCTEDWGVTQDQLEVFEADMPEDRTILIIRSRSRNGYYAAISIYTSISNTLLDDRRPLFIMNWQRWLERAVNLGEYDSIRSAWAAIQSSRREDVRWIDDRDSDIAGESWTSPRRR